MSDLIFCLDKTIKKIGVTPNRVAVEAKVPPNTVYNMIENKTSRIHMETIKSLLDAINRIALEEGIKQKFLIQDVIKYLP